MERQRREDNRRQYKKREAKKRENHVIKAWGRETKEKTERKR